jgi:phage terminase large subunit-like protein
MDGKKVTVIIQQEPGSMAPNYINLIRRTVLRGYAVSEHIVHGRKFDRAGSLASIQEAGDVDLVQAGWNAPFMLQCEQASPNEKDYQNDDMWDAAAGAYDWVTEKAREFGYTNTSALENKIGKNDPLDDDDLCAEDFKPRGGGSRWGSGRKVYG